VDAEIMNILKAKRDAIEALAFAMAEQVKNGYLANGESALRFVKTWAEAVDAMVPAEDVQTFGPNCEVCHKPGGTIQVNPYALEISGQTIEMRLHDECCNELAADT
jgi:hypothetical protein